MFDKALCETEALWGQGKGRDLFIERNCCGNSYGGGLVPPLVLKANSLEESEKNVRD